MKSHFLVALLLLSMATLGQDGNFKFGQITYKDLDKAKLDLDTSAAAVVLREFGEAYIDEDRDFNLVFNYHVVIKILKSDGLRYADFQIPLYHNESQKEEMISIKASSFSEAKTGIMETKLGDREIFNEKTSKYWNHAKFAVPNVAVGSVIEVEYSLVSPFIFKFRDWQFQREIPKLKSEFWATIPGNYIYNTTLRGYLDLSRNDSEIIKNCFYNGRADCARYKYAMQNIPAFVEEDHMTAKSNFLAAINYELSEIRYFDGRVNKFTKEWKDAESELRSHEKFGIQLRRGEDVVDGHVKEIIASEQDALQKAKKIYEFIKMWYIWDEGFGMLSEFGIKKAFEKKTGNVADINLSLIAALKFADFQVDPVILSTRANGLPIELHPVLSDFNYVVGRLELNGKQYLLDATDDFLPFGLLPLRCFNGKGRVMGEGGSYWMELKPTDKDKIFTAATLKVQADGTIVGNIKRTHFGYAAVTKRKELAGAANVDDYLSQLKGNSVGLEIKNHQVEFKDDIYKELTETFEVTLDDDAAAAFVMINPFLFDRIQENPFKTQERKFPVDFGIPIDRSLLFSLELSDSYELAEVPEKAALMLPGGGGRYLYAVQQLGNKITLNSVMNVNKPVFTSDEYHFIRELYNRVVQLHNLPIVLQKKK